MHFKTKWSKQSKNQRRISLLNLLVNHHSSDAKNFIELVEAGREGIFASTDIKYSYAIFGRDSIEVAEDLLSSHKKLARNVILTLASLQGLKFDDKSEEEPGKIHHEYRASHFDGHPISDQSANILLDLQKIWGSDCKNDLVYYGSFDSTPLYIRLVGRYVETYGKDILEKTYIDRANVQRNIQHSLDFAETWLVDKLIASPLGLLEYLKLNPLGIDNQVWKDSSTSYMHLDGTIANTNKGIASIELQGYAYDALKTIESFASSVTSKEKLHSLAAHIQTTVLEKFWLAEEHFFAEGLDYDEKGKSRQIKTLCSNGGALMESNLLRDLPEKVHTPLVQDITNHLFGPQFLTLAGIRSRAMKHKNLPGYIDYHGSYTVWPKETYDIAKGLRNFGLGALAEQLEGRILASVQSAGEFYEFFYVDDDDKLHYEKDDVLMFLKARKSLGSPLPQKGQAWVISAVIGIEDRRNSRGQRSRPTDFELTVLNKMPSFDVNL